MFTRALPQRGLEPVVVFKHTETEAFGCKSNMAVHHSEDEWTKLLKISGNTSPFWWIQIGISIWPPVRLLYAAVAEIFGYVDKDQICEY